MSAASRLLLEFCV
uniref:Uncharacterized protein n=1 Tax=Arundo donax TaxID=35708 RepID=A0A0A9FDY7_ARUDO